jgi:hypothetical protein
MFHDNDLLVDRDQLPAAVAVLREIGYVQGSWDYATGSVRPAPRRQVMHMAMHSHQTYSYMKPTPESSVPVASSARCALLDRPDDRQP